jgi:Fe-S cluster assembly iron-binding protein IscA
MLTITEAAGAHLAQLLDRAAPPEGAVMRLGPGEAGDLALQFDQLRPDDTTFEHEEKTVLVLDAQLAQRLAETTLDVRVDDERPHLFLRH